MMKCPKCEHENREGANFCDLCGYSLRKSDQTAPIDYRQPHSYTPKHLKEKILTSRSAIEGERKLVTVMFADVTGFTPMAERLDPEDVHQIMNGCFRILMDEVHKCEGTVNEFRGDGVMALFGAPIAHEDHAQRACVAALAVQQGLVPYGEKLRTAYGIDFKVRIGLNSGPVVVGAIGDDLRMDYTAQGDTANLAARMESNADPGTVLVSEQTYRLAKEFFEFEPLGKIQVKGKEQPVAAYRLRDKAYKARARSERAIYSDMVGRDQELARLELQVLKAVNGEGSVVNVIGEAGIGKSRLLAELKKREVVKRVSFLEGRAISMGKNLSFHPVIDLLKNWAHIREEDSESIAANKLEAAIRRVSADEVDEIFPFVATMMGTKLSGKHAERVKGIEGESLEKLVFKNVRDLLIRSTERIPIVIVIEDLHWADTSSLLLLDSAYGLARTQKLVFINVFRPGYWGSGEATVETLKKRLPDLPLVEIVLQPLDPQCSEALINNMLNIKGLHHGVKGQIIERAGGNPFFIEEVVRSLIDEGAVKVTESGFEVTDEIHSVVIPPTIQDVLMARIDRLDEDSRNLIKIASVIGRSFFYRILAEVVTQAEGLDDKLAHLKEIQLIRERTRMQELEYLFKHALAQEAAYESTLLQQRKQLHLKVAEAIELIFSERLHEFYGILALHYSKADNLDKAEEYMVKAGEEALKSSASSEAITYFLQALQLYVEQHSETADPEKLAAFEKNIAIAYFNKGQHQNAVHYFDKLFLRWRRRPPTSQVSIMGKLAYDVLIGLLRLRLPWISRVRIPDQRVSEFFDLAQKKDKALILANPRRCVTEMIGEFRESFIYDLKRLPSAAVFHLTTSGMFSYAGFCRVADLVLDHAKNLVDEKRIPDLVCHQMVTTLNNYMAGRWSEIPDFDFFLFEAGTKNGVFWDLTAYSYFQGAAKVYQGKFNEAQEFLGNLFQLEDKYQFRTGGTRYGLLTEYLLVSRRTSPAQTEANNLLSDAVERGLDPWELQGLGWKGLIQVLSGDVTGAKEALAYADQVRSKRAFWPPWILASSFLGQFMLDLAHLKDALGGDSRERINEYIERAAEKGDKAVSNSGKFPAHRTWNYQLMGQYYWLIGKQRKALKWFEKSIKEGERLGARPDLSRTYMEVGKRLLEPHSKYSELNGISAREYLDKAEMMFKDMDLGWDLEQLERVRLGN
jgi:class 3 adenylate cyclase/tetratricopeptide (TPR) repeat protein